MANIKNYGLAGASGDLQLGKSGGRLVYNTGTSRFDFFANDGTTLEDIRAGGLLLGASTAVTSILDDDTFAADSNTALATQQSIKSYIDTVTNNGAMLTAGDTGSGSIIFASETFTLSGNVNQIVTAFEGTNTFRVSLVESPVIQGNLTVNGIITDGTATITSGDITTSGTIDAGTIEFDNLSGTGAVSITDIIDDDTLATASATTLATSESIKAYIDTELTSGGLAMNIAGDSGTGTIVFSSETYNVFGTANQITSTFNGTETMTLSLPEDLIAPANLTVTTNLTTSLTAGRVPFITTGGLVTDDAGLTFASGSGTLNATIVQFGDLSDGAISIANFIDDDTMGTASATTLATSESTKAYIDAETAKNSTLTVNADGSTTGDVILDTQALNIIGTANEIETNMTNQTLQIGLPDNIIVGSNLTVTGSLLSDDITSTAISINGDATVTGNLTVQGSTTIVDSTTVEIADATFRVNSDGGVVSAGLEANIAGVIESVLYVPGSSRWELSGNVYTGENLTVVGTGDFGTVEFNNLSGTGAVSVTDILDEDTLGSDSESALATQQSIKAYVDGQVSGSAITANLSISGDSGSGTVFIASEDFRVLGGTNINTAVTDGAGGNVITVNLDDTVSTGNVSATNSLSFGTLVDTGEGINITKFVDEADGISNNDDDTSIPTTAAIIDYVDNNGGDGMLLRNSFTADSAASTFSVGTTPNVSSRTYYLQKITVNIGTAFSGGSVNQITISDGSTVFAVADDTDLATTGTYLIQQDGVDALAKNVALTVSFFESNGTTPAIPTAGVITVMAEYAYV